MKRRVCENCLKDYEVERNEGSPFPSFTVIGGIVGTIAGLAMGAVLLVPAGLLAGFAADVARCDECGSDKNRIYEFMIEEDDEWSSKIYKTLEFPTKQYRYDNLERRLVLIETPDEPASIDSPEFDMSLPDFSIDFDVSFETPGFSSQAESSGSDMGGVGEGGSASGSGEGGGSGGAASGGGTGGGK